MFAVGADSIIAWGDNAFGLLGSGVTRETLWYSETPVLVALPPGAPIMDFQCTLYSCYVLYDSGQVFSWGSNSGTQLGRSLGADYDPMPSLAILIAETLKVQDMFTNAGAGAVFMRGTLLPPINRPALALLSAHPSHA